MSAFWNVPFRNPRPELVQAFASDPGTRGWYVADEPMVEEGGGARWWTQQIHTLDPVHPTLSVHFGCSRAQAAGAMRPFKDAADWLGTDCYPVGPASSRNTAPSFAGGADIAGRYGKPFWAVTPAASWAQMCGEPYADAPSPPGLHLARCRSCGTARRPQGRVSLRGSRSTTSLTAESDAYASSRRRSDPPSAAARAVPSGHAAARSGQGSGDAPATPAAAAGRPERVVGHELRATPERSGTSKSPSRARCGDSTGPRRIRRNTGGGRPGTYAFCAA
jgi:hypothetical protein